MTRNNFSLVQLLCTSILSAFVGMLMVILAIVVKPHTATTAATVRTAAHVASISHVKASIILEAPTVANIEVVPATTEAKTTEAKTTEAAKVVTSSEVNNSLSDAEIQKAKDYCLKHMVKAEFVDLETQDPPILIAAR